jgi:hypothetical protein
VSDGFSWKPPTDDPIGSAATVSEPRPLSLWAAIALVLIISSHVAIADPLGSLDTNRNHIVEEAEAQAAGRRLFDRLDKDRDGRLQANELNGRLGAPVMKAADPDADGGLNTQEYASLLTARYKSANENADGTLDSDELASLAGRLLLVMLLP